MASQNGWEQLVCEGCGWEGRPRPATPNVVPCSRCGGANYRRRPVIAFDDQELDLLIELAEFPELRSGMHLGVLEKLHAEQRWALA